MADTQNLTDSNVIAYNGNLREQLQELHEMLGTEVTDVADVAMQMGYKIQGDVQKIIKYLSAMAAKLSIGLMEAKKTKPNLTPQEQNDFNSIKSLTATLGNLQDKLSRVVKLTVEANVINEQIKDKGLDLAEYIMNAQGQFRQVRAEINSFGYLSQNPELANLFEMQNSKST